MGEKLIRVRAANEEAAFHGIVKTAMQEFDTYVTAHPGDSFEQLQKQRDRMMTAIKSAGEKATTGIAKRNNTNWLAANRGHIKEMTQTSMEAIRSRQELETYHQQQENNINNLDDAAYITASDNMVAAGLITPQYAKARAEHDLSVIDKARQEVAIKNAKSGLEAQIFTIAAKQGYDAAEELLRDPATTAQLIESGIKREDIKSLLTDVGERLQHQKADAKLKAEQATEQSIEAINGRLNNRELSGIDDFINGLPLTEAQKNKEILKAHAFTKAVNDATSDIATSDETNIKVDMLVNDVRHGRVTYEDALQKYAVLAKDINAKEGEAHLDDIMTASELAKSPVLKRPVVTRGQDVIDRMRMIEVAAVKADMSLKNSEQRALIAGIEAKALLNQSNLDKWAIDNADIPDFNKKYQDQVDALFRAPIEEVTLNWLQRTLRLSEKTPVVGAIPKLAGTSEESALAKKQMKALRGHTVFKDMTEQEKQSAQKLFDAGWSLKDVINLLLEAK
jgi:hypothetical protein